MKKERKLLRVADLQLNEGQLGWLPKNPRQWTQEDIDKTAKSIAEDEDFLEDRPILVVPNGKKYVVFAGNLRSEGAKKQKLKDAPCVVYYPETEADQEVVVRRAAKDNGTFGAWDYDILANEWGDMPLGDWGVPSWGTGEDDEEPSDLDAEPRAKPFVLKVTFPTAEKMSQFVAAYKDVLENDYGCTISEGGGEL